MNPSEITKEIVVAAINNELIHPAQTAEEGAKRVAEFYDIVYKQVVKNHNER